VIDTAPWYGHGKSETVLGKALEGVPRSAYYLNTKVGRSVKNHQPFLRTKKKKKKKKNNQAEKRKRWARRGAKRAILRIAIPYFLSLFFFSLSLSQLRPRAVEDV
jgi:aryl-alcohol dehydrogenase-like predicted oxidoreductase